MKPPVSLLFRCALAALFSVPVLIATGCGMGTSAADGNSFVANATIKGAIHGGQSPIVGSTVNLYAAGTTGYGTGATLLATTTTTNGGVFAFTQNSILTGPTSPVTSVYGCPSNSSLLYITVTSGDPTGAGTTANYNPNIEELAALGQCSGVATNYYNISEVTTVISAAALQQYMDPYTLTIGAPSTTPMTSNRASALTGITNAFALALAMTNYQYGDANGNYEPTGAAGQIQATPDVAKINTLANVIASCVNTTGSSSGTCTSLLAAATPTAYTTATNFNASYVSHSGAAATNTLQALLFMLQNPQDLGTQVTSCNGSSTTSNLACLYSLASSTPPYGNALTAAPTDWTVAVSYGYSLKNSAGLYILDEPLYLAADSKGNIWYANLVSGNYNLNEISPTGAPMYSSSSTLTLASPYTVLLDSNGNTWVTNSGSTAAPYTVTEYTTTGVTKTVTVSNLPYYLAGDGQGNVFVLEGAAGVVEEIANGASAVTSPAIATGLTLSKYSTMVVDSNYNLWITTGGTNLVEVPFASGSYGTATVITAADVTAGEPMALDNNNNLWVANYSTTAPTAGVVSAASPSTESSYSVTGATGGLEGVAIDGAGNAWFSNYTTTTTAFFELTNTGVELSPTTGFGHTAYHPHTVVVDPSGDVWIGGTDSYTYAYSLSELIGGAVPVVTPLAAALPAAAGGTSYVGTTPQ